MLKKNELNENLRISEGNFVLKSTNEVGFMIFDLPACYCCPYATDWCKKYCYAKSPQDIFKDSVLNSRMRNYEESKKESFIKDMIDIIEFNLQRKKFKTKNKIYFRFHGSGDIYSKEYFEKLISITNHFKSNKKIVFQTYTKSLPIISQYDINNINLKIIFSVVQDTKEIDINKAKSLGLSIFNAVSQTDDISNGYVCKGDCSKCQVCYEKNNIETIYVETHGSRIGKKDSSRIEQSSKNYRDNNKTVRA